MSDQTPPTPDADPTAALPAVVPQPPAADLPAVDVPVVEAPAAESAAPAQWPAEGYPPPAAPAAPPTYPAVEATQPPTYPAAPAYPAAYPPPGYGAAPAAPQTSSNAIIALILAIVSWAVCPIIPAIVALVLASSAAKEIEASGGRTQGAGLVTASRIVSWVNIGLWSAILVVGGFFVVLAIVAGGMNETRF